MSPFGGMGMKASPGDHVIGVAQAAFDSDTQGAQSQEVKNIKGVTKKIWTGAIPVTIAIGIDNESGLNSEQQLHGLQKFIWSLTGHVIPVTRIVISLVVTILAIIALVTLIYASTYGSIISIGRNPLAKYSILRSLRYVLIATGFIALVACLLLYLLLN